MHVVGSRASTVREATWQQCCTLVTMVVEHYFGDEPLARIDHGNFSAAEYDAAVKDNWVVGFLRSNELDYSSMGRSLAAAGEAERSVATADKSELAWLAEHGDAASSIVARWRLEMCIHALPTASPYGSWGVSSEDLEELRALYASHAHAASFASLKVWGDGRNYVSDGSCLYWALRRNSRSIGVTIEDMLKDMYIPDAGLGNYRASETSVDLLAEALTTSDATRLSEIMLVCDRRDVLDDVLPSSGCIVWCSRLPMRLDPYIVAEWRLRGRLGLA